MLHLQESCLHIEAYFVSREKHIPVFSIMHNVILQEGNAGASGHHSPLLSQRFQTGLEHWKEDLS